MDPMTERVQYLIAQYQADPLRKEPRNVGVIARMDGRTLARFVGEKEDGRIDGRELRWMRFPDVYRQWVFYWRETASAVGVLEELIDSNKGNYGLLRGGKVFDTGNDPLEQVVDHLYARFVGGGFTEAMRENEGQLMAELKLTQSLASELAALNILMSGAKAPQGVAHPVQQKRAFTVRNSVVYRPEFSQENSVLYVIETFDFTQVKTKSLYDHAGLTAYMFKDLRTELAKVETIAVVKSNAEVEKTEHITNSTKMLEREGKVIDWNDDAARSAFLEERRQVALG